MKNFEGVIISTGMNKTVVVEVFRKTPHPLYRKLIKRSKKYKVDNTGFEDIVVGTTVKITETRPISRNKYFKISEIVNTGAKSLKTPKKDEQRVEKPKVEEEKVEAVSPVKKDAKKAVKPSGVKVAKDKKESSSGKDKNK